MTFVALVSLLSAFLSFHLLSFHLLPSFYSSSLSRLISFAVTLKDKTLKDKYIPRRTMGFLDKIKAKFHNDSSNKNRMLYTENNQEQFGVDADDTPRNRMMDTISNEQGAEVLGKKNNPGLEYSEETPNRNLMTHTISNEQAEELAQGTDITKDDSEPRNKLLDIEGNEGFVNPEKGTNFTGKANSTRLL